MPIKDLLFKSTNEGVVAKTYSKEQRDKLAKTGVALPDGSYPIVDKQDLKNAIQAFGRAKNKARVRRHIIKRARALGATSLLPDDWKVTASIPVGSLEFLFDGDGEAELPVDVVNEIIRAATAQRQVHEGDPLLVDIADVEILKAGIDYNLASGKTTFTPEDLADAVEAVKNPNITVPRIGLGHNGPISDEVAATDEPSVGTVNNMRLTDDGQTILGDYTGVPTWLAEIVASAYPSRSIRGQFNRDVNGHKYRLVITAVDLLGVVWPGCSSIEDIQALYSKEGPDNIEVIEASEGEAMPRQVAASIGAEDVRRAFYETVAVGDRSYWWLTAHYQEPPVLIAEDAAGKIYSIGYKFENDQIVFDDPVPVVRQYVEEESGQVAADVAPVAVFASREESLPKQSTQEDRMTPEQIKLLRSRLGLSEDKLPDDATPEQLTAILAETPAPPATTPAEPPTTDPGEQPPAQPQPTPQVPGQPQPQPTPTPQPEPQPQPQERVPVAAASGPQIPEGMSLVDNTVLAGFKDDHDFILTLKQDTHKSNRDQVVKAAVGAGKFAPSRVEHYEKLYDADPEGTTQLIASLAEGLVPVEARAATTADFSSSDEAYPTQWLPEVVARQAENGRRVTVGED